MMIVDTNFRQTAVVGPHGDYRTLDEAIKMVEEFTTIFITEGVYEITQPIRKKGLIFEPRDSDKQVFIVGHEGPSITIKLDHEDFVVFKKIIFLHSGDFVQKKFIEAAPYEIKYCQEPNTTTVKEFEI